MILTKKEKAQLQEMIELEKITRNAKSAHSVEFTDAMRKWHSDYPDKLKEIRREEMRKMGLI